MVLVCVCMFLFFRTNFYTVSERVFSIYFAIDFTHADHRDRIAKPPDKAAWADRGARPAAVSAIFKYVRHSSVSAALSLLVRISHAETMSFLGPFRSRWGRTVLQVKIKNFVCKTS